MQLLFSVFVLTAIGSTYAFLPPASSQWPWCRGNWATGLDEDCDSPPFGEPCDSHIKCYNGKAPACRRPLDKQICQSYQEYKQCCDDQFRIDMVIQCSQLPEQCVGKCKQRVDDIYGDVIGSAGRDTFLSIVCGHGTTSSKADATNTVIWIPNDQPASELQTEAETSSKPEQQVPAVLPPLSAFLPPVEWPWCSGNWTTSLEGECGSPPFQQACSNHGKCYDGKSSCRRPIDKHICPQYEEYKRCCDNQFLRDMVTQCWRVAEQCMDSCVKRAQAIYRDASGGAGEKTFLEVACRELVVQSSNKRKKPHASK